jgi:hypothetical protein
MNVISSPPGRRAGKRDIDVTDLFRKLFEVEGKSNFSNLPSKLLLQNQLGVHEVTNE